MRGALFNPPKVALRTESMESHHDKDRKADNPKDSA